jgi:hypothetical protein
VVAKEVFFLREIVVVTSVTCDLVFPHKVAPTTYSL